MFFAKMCTPPRDNDALYRAATAALGTFLASHLIGFVAFL